MFFNDVFGFIKRDLSVGEEYSKPACNYSVIDLDCEINGCEKNIYVNEMEVFQVLFE